MGFFDFIKNLLNNNKKNARLITKELIKNYGEPNPLEVALYDGNIPLPGKKIKFNINGVDYYRVTDNEGIARMNINLGPGKYTPLISFSDEEYNLVTAFTDIIIKTVQKATWMEGIDINMTYNDGTVYQCAVYDDAGRVAGNVDLTVNGVTYRRTPDNTGLYKLNIRLSPGNYTITAKYLGDESHLPSSVTNTIKINEAKKDDKKEVTCTNPYTSSPHPTASGCNGMGQNNAYCCGPSALHKILYKFGIRDISQSQISSWAGTTSNGTSHQGLETAIAKINQVKGTKLSITWYNKSDLSWEKIGQIICQPNKGIFCHLLYKNGGVCTGSGNFGHYETLVKVNTATKYVKVINSLGGKCNNGCYCGYYQDRTIACQEQFIRGISQKSIAVITKN